MKKRKSSSRTAQANRPKPRDTRHRLHIPPGTAWPPPEAVLKRNTHRSVLYDVARKVNKITSEFTLIIFFYKNIKIQNGTVRPHHSDTRPAVPTTRLGGTSNDFKHIEQFRETNWNGKCTHIGTDRIAKATESDRVCEVWYLGEEEFKVATNIEYRVIEWSGRFVL